MDMNESLPYVAIGLFKVYSTDGTSVAEMLKTPLTSFRITLICIDTDSFL